MTAYRVLHSDRYHVHTGAVCRLDVSEDAVAAARRSRVVWEKNSAKSRGWIPWVWMN